jgi:hypothetical protein
MTIKFDPVTRAELNGAVSKLHWIALLETALGNTRRLRCRRVPDTNADGAWETGSEFRNVGSTGPFTSVAGMITRFGRIKGTTVSLAADMSLGQCLLRLEGNGRWLQGTLGLSHAAQLARGVTEENLIDYDFTVERDFTATNGFGTTLAFTVSGHRLLPSGTGPAVPALTDSAPASIELFDYTDANNPISKGVITFNNREDDFIYEDAEMAAEIGDVGVYLSQQSIVYGRFEFGVMMLVSAATNTEDGLEPLYQVLVACKPYGEWLTYPTVATYDTKASQTHPKAFKVVMKNAAGAVIHTFQMRDGLAINSPEISEYRTQTKASRPKFNCSMMLPWSNKMVSTSIHQKKRFNGMDPEILRPRLARAGDAVNARWPLISAGWSANSMLHMYGLPRWSMPSPIENDDAAEQAQRDLYDPKPYDPWLYNGTGYYYRQYEGGVNKAIGWDYEPGSSSGHDWYCAPGGPRFDRAVVPSVLALWATDKNYRRPQGNVAIRDMVEAWGKAYFNHSTHYVTDVKKFTTVDFKSIMDGEWSYNWGYYSVRPATAQFPTSRVVDINAVLNANDVSDWNLNGENELPYAGWAADSLHAYNAPGLWPLVFNSPMHTIASKHRFVSQRLAALADGSPKQNPMNYYMSRVHAWRWMHYVFNWKNASNHYLGITRESIEQALQTEIELIWDKIYKPAMIDNAQDIQSIGFRRLGCPIDWDGNSKLSAGGIGLGFYMTHVFAFMKTTGMWDVMINKNQKCRESLLWTMRNFAMNSVDFCLDGKGRLAGYPPITKEIPGGWEGVKPELIPNSWADWATNYYPATGEQDMIRNAAGVILENGYEDEVNVHWRMQWPRMQKLFFPEVTYPRLDAAVAMINQWDADVKANFLAGNSDWHYRYPSQGFLRAPGTSDPART